MGQGTGSREGESGSSGFRNGAGPGPSEAERKRVAVELIRSHDAALRASARRYSLCAADAEDAYQRGIEILLRKAPVADPRQLLPWARTVIKHESLALRRARERLLVRPGELSGAREEPESTDWIERLEAPGAWPEETVIDRERVDLSREALAELKPDERKALTQLAEGYSYAEIGALNGWTYTKVNRCLAEGRERLRTVVRQSEAGERCGLIEPLVSACSDGELPAERVAEVGNHLAACGSCRALLREYRAIPGKVVALLPLPAFATADGVGDAGPSLAQGLAGGLREVWYGLAGRLSGLFTGSDRSVVATLAGGGARGPGSLALAKLTAVCIGTAGGAAACVATGVVPGVQLDRGLQDRPTRERSVPREVVPGRADQPVAVSREWKAVKVPSGTGPQAPKKRTTERANRDEPTPGVGSQTTREFGAGGVPGEDPTSVPQPAASPTPVQSRPSGSSRSTGSGVPLGGSGEFGP